MRSVSVVVSPPSSPFSLGGRRRPLPLLIVLMVLLPHWRHGMAAGIAPCSQTFAAPDLDAVANAVTMTATSIVACLEEGVFSFDVYNYIDVAIASIEIRGSGVDATLIDLKNGGFLVCPGGSNDNMAISLYNMSFIGGDTEGAVIYSACGENTIILENVVMSLFYEQLVLSNALVEAQMNNVTIASPLIAKGSNVFPVMSLQGAMGYFAGFVNLTQFTLTNFTNGHAGTFFLATVEGFLTDLTCIGHDTSETTPIQYVSGYCLTTTFSELVIRRANVSNNAGGQPITVTSPATVTFVDSLFADSSTFGTMFIDGDVDLTIQSSSFLNLGSTYQGTAIYASGPSKHVTLHDVYVSGSNSAVAIHFEGETLTITNSSFTDNRGGALDLLQGFANISYTAICGAEAPSYDILCEVSSSVFTISPGCGRRVSCCPEGTVIVQVSMDGTIACDAPSSSSSAPPPSSLPPPFTLTSFNSSSSLVSSPSATVTNGTSVSQSMNFTSPSSDGVDDAVSDVVPKPGLFSVWMFFVGGGAVFLVCCLGLAVGLFINKSRRAAKNTAAATNAETSLVVTPNVTFDEENATTVVGVGGNTGFTTRVVSSRQSDGASMLHTSGTNFEGSGRSEASVVVSIRSVGLGLGSGTSLPTFPDMDSPHIVGRGGQATVYSAFCFSLGETVCLKVFSEATQFEREMTVLSSVPPQKNIVKVYSLRDVPANTMVMQYASDGSLYDALEGSKGLTPKDAVEIASGIVAGLCHLHDNGVSHLDIKPANILLTSGMNGRSIPLITDFGAAFLQGRSHLRVSMCTVAYAAPEVLSLLGGRSLHEANLISYSALDVYSFGLVLWEMFSKQKPREGRSGTKVVEDFMMDPATADVDISLVKNKNVREIVSMCLMTVNKRPKALHTVQPLLQTLNV